MTPTDWEEFVLIRTDCLDEPWEEGALLFLLLLILRVGKFRALEEEARVLCQKVVNSYVACRKKGSGLRTSLKRSSMVLEEDLLTIGFGAIRPFFFANLAVVCKRNMCEKDIGGKKEMLRKKSHLLLLEFLLLRWLHL